MFLLTIHDLGITTANDTTLAKKFQAFIRQYAPYFGADVAMNEHLGVTYIHSDDFAHDESHDDGDEENADYDPDGEQEESYDEHNDDENKTNAGGRQLRHGHHHGHGHGDGEWIYVEGRNDSYGFWGGIWLEKKLMRNFRLYGRYWRFRAKFWS